MTQPEFPTRRARRLHALANANVPSAHTVGHRADTASLPVLRGADTADVPAAHGADAAGLTYLHSADTADVPARHGADTADLTHLRPDGSAHMVDVGEKPVTPRRAVAHATVVTRADVVHAVIEGSLPKGEAISTARIAGIMAAKQTSNLIPLCHPLPLTAITVDITGDLDRLHVVATVATTAVTGVEMEALTAASVAALTLYDMIKGVDKLATLTDIRVVEKSGGRSGDWSRP